MQFGAAGTIEGWVYANGVGTLVSNFVSDAGTNSGVELGLSSANQQLEIFYGTGSGSPFSYADAQAPGQTQWHHVATTFSSSGVALYIDGMSASPSAQPASPVNSGAAIVLGGAPDGGNLFSGLFDEVAIYNRALGSQEIRDIVDAGANGRCKR